MDETHQEFGTHGNWQAHKDDGIRLAALRWFALTIEKSAIELYATNPKTYGEMGDILRETLKEIGKLRDKTREDDEKRCPEGYIRCENGLCQPSCDIT